MLGIETKNLANNPDNNFMENEITPTLNRQVDVTFDY